MPTLSPVHSSHGPFLFFFFLFFQMSLFPTTTCSHTCKMENQVSTHTSNQNSLIFIPSQHQSIKQASALSPTAPKTSDRNIILPLSFLTHHLHIEVLCIPLSSVTNRPPCLQRRVALPISSRTSFQLFAFAPRNSFLFNLKEKPVH